MARPRQTVRRSAIINIRIKRDEKIQIQKNAKNASMNTTRFMIARSLYVKIVPKYDEQMIDALNRAAGLVKHVAITYVGEEMRKRLWVAVKELRQTVAAIMAVVSRELELPKVIGSELKKLLEIADEMRNELTAYDEKPGGDLKQAVESIRAQIVRLTGCAQTISKAYQREVEQLEIVPEEDKILDKLVDYVMTVAGLKADIFALHQHGATAHEIRNLLRNRNIDLPVSAIELLLGAAQTVAQTC